MPLVVVVVDSVFFSVDVEGKIVVLRSVFFSPGFTTVVLFSVFFSAGGLTVVDFCSHAPRSATLVKMQSSFFINLVGPLASESEQEWTPALSQSANL